MRVFNKFVESKTEPWNKQDIWFDGSTIKLYKEGKWEEVTVDIETVKKLKEFVDKFEMFKLVDELPEVGNPNTVYLILSKNAVDKNTLAEYIYINDAWEEIGGSIPVDMLKLADALVVFAPSKQSVITAEEFKSFVQKYSLVDSTTVSKLCLFKVNKQDSFSCGLLSFSSNNQYQRIDIITNNGLPTADWSSMEKLYQANADCIDYAWLYDTQYNILTPLGSSSLSDMFSIKDKSITYNMLETAAINKILSDAKLKLVIPTTYLELKDLRDKGELIPGQQYRITDYVTSVISPRKLSARHPFDLIVTALDNKTLNPEAKAIHHEGDTYFVNQDLSKWKIWYSLDPIIPETMPPYYKINVGIGGFSDKEMVRNLEYVGTLDNIENNLVYVCDTIADEWFAVIIKNKECTQYEVFYNGHPIENIQITFREFYQPITGTIYRMIDENNVDCPYDFKNVYHAYDYDNRELNFRFQERFDANHKFNYEQYLDAYYIPTFSDAYHNESSKCFSNVKIESCYTDRAFWIPLVCLVYAANRLHSDIYIGDHSSFTDWEEGSLPGIYKNIRIGNNCEISVRPSEDISSLCNTIILDNITAVIERHYNSSTVTYALNLNGEVKSGYLGDLF